MEISDANKLTQKYEKDWNQHRCLLSGEGIPNKLTHAKFGLRTRYHMRPILADGGDFDCKEWCEAQSHIFCLFLRKCFPTSFSIPI